MDAEQSFLVINGGNCKFVPPPLPQWIPECAPESYTAFSDGSFTHPITPTFGLMSAAVWWPGRDAVPSELEEDFTVCTCTGKGVETIGYHLGCIGSSARAEI
eukprot:4278511-Karenia_brevis.AAC.1